MNAVTDTWRGHLRIARFELAAAAVGSSWLMLLLAPAVEPAERINPALATLGTGWSLLAGAVAAVGLVGGHLWMTAATRAAAAMLLVAVAAAMVLGEASGGLALLVAVGVVVHNVVGRYVPAVGIVTLGLMGAAGMAIVNPPLSFGHPIALAMTHVMGCAVLLHVYDRRRPRLGAESVVLVGGGWAFWMLLGVTLIGQRRQTITVGGEHALMWIGPMSALALWIVIAAACVKRRVPAERLRRAATLWLLVYAIGWLLGAGLFWPAVAVAAVGAAGWALERWRRGCCDGAEGGVNYRIA